MTEFAPAEAFPPGEFLRDELEERGWTQKQFARIIGRHQSFVSSIISGKRTLSPDAAVLFSAALGTSAQFWMNLDTAYRLYLLRQNAPAPERVAREAQLNDAFPIEELVRRGWVRDSEDTDVLEARVLRFYGIDSLDEKPNLRYAARHTREDRELSPAQEAWLHRVKQIAGETTISPYSEGKLRASLDQLLALRTDPQEARHVPRLLSDCGVRFVIVEPMKASKIDGICFWLAEDQPVIGMSLRIDRIDNFWFVLRHEVEHVLRGDGKEAVIVDSQLCDALESTVDQSPEENAANTAAAEFCAPQEELSDFLNRVGSAIPEERVVLFAERIGVHPGLVVGQLHNRFQRYNFLRKYLERVRHIVVPNAIADGYGRQLLEAVE